MLLNPLKVLGWMIAWFSGEDETLQQTCVFLTDDEGCGRSTWFVKGFSLGISVKGSC